MHTHTIVSGHAYSSLQEMAKAAADKGLEILGVTEHGPSIPGTCQLIYFHNMHVIPRTMYCVRLLLGSDAHISFQIADYTNLYPLLAETEFPDELILNYDTARLTAALQKS